MRYLQAAEKREHKEAENLEKLYRRILTPLIENRGKRLVFKLVLWGTFLFTLSFFYFNLVAVKMLPLDNKPEFSVVLDMPEGTALPVTANLAHRMADKLRTLPEVTAIQLYAGTARPFDFNGMVRHYYLRSDPWQGELQVQLTDKHDRDRTSHEIAVEARELLGKLIEGTGAVISVVEMPPGPPVLQSVVAEVYGPTPELRRQFARELTDIFKQTESARDVDNYLRGAFDYWRFNVDTEKAVRRGISVDTINRNLAMALGGAPVGDIKPQAGRQIGHEPIEILLQVPLAERSQVDRLGDLPIQSNQGYTVPLRELGEFQLTPEEDIIFHKDLRPVEYVVADVGGRLAAPVYAMFQVERLLNQQDYTAPDGTKPQGGAEMDDAIFWLGAPPDSTRLAWTWAGEWTVTYETFRDMGAAFGVALVLIYILVVWEFGNFRIPLVIMAPIPLTLLGIIPAHALMFTLGLGGEFTATSMIGWIALAGIIVRNSILLVDFAIHEIQKGVPVAEAMIRSCKIRTRPIVITALALVAGSSVIITDPIFQGMAISLLSGVLVSTVLTLIVIPLGCVAAGDDMCRVALATAPPGTSLPCLAETEDPKAATSAAAPAVATSGGVSRFFGKVVEGFILALYAVRGIFLLLFDAAKTALKARSGRDKRPPVARPPAAAGSGSGSTRAAGQAGAARAEETSSVKPAAPPPASGPVLAAADQGGAARAEEASSVKHAAPAPTVAKKPPAAKPEAAKPAAKPAARKAPVKKLPAADKAPAGEKPTQGVQKKAPRRGIRLKIDDETDPDVR
jgi:multidrug efflux pump subunit AcrB